MSRRFLVLLILMISGMVSGVLSEPAPRHILAIGDSVERFIVNDFCVAMGGLAEDWGHDWHRYMVSQTWQDGSIGHQSAYACMHWEWASSSCVDLHVLLPHAVAQRAYPCFAVFLGAS